MKIVAHIRTNEGLLVQPLVPSEVLTTGENPDNWWHNHAWLNRILLLMCLVNTALGQPWHLVREGLAAQNKVQNMSD